MAVYLDASALAKLVHHESGSDDLTAWLDERSDRLVSSDLARTELFRLAHRAGGVATQRTRAVLDSLHLEPITTSLTEAAGSLLPGAPLRSLEAIHVATAMVYGDDLEAFVTYDQRQADAARVIGLHVASPGHDHED